MKRASLHGLTACAALAGTAAAAGALVLYAGVYDISAIEPHTRPVHRILAIARDRSIERRAQSVRSPPADLSMRTGEGFALYAEHCVRCHGAPGIAPESFALGLEPAAMPLAQSGRELDARALYWIVRNGIKMTGMPAFAFRVDEAGLWALVAAVQALPTLTPAEYRALDASSQRAPPAAPTPPGEPDAARGRTAVGQYGCTACHTIPGWPGPDARAGPPLSGIG